MTYILLVTFPVVMGAACFLLRKQTLLAIAGGVLTMLAEIGLALQLPTDSPARLLGLTLSIDPLSRLFLVLFCGIAALAFIVAWRVPHGENFVPISLLMLGFTAATLVLIQEPYVVSLLLISASISAVLAIVDMPAGSSALLGRASIAVGLKYLIVIVVAGVAMYFGFVLASIYRPDIEVSRVPPAHLILALLAIGFGIRLAVVPFHSWLPDLTETTAPMVSVIVISVVNITSLLFLINTFQFFPFLIDENDRGLAVLRALGLATPLLGAALALARPGIRGIIGCLVVYDAGVIFFGLATITPLGLAGALFDAFNQTLIVALLFLTIGLLERPDGRPASLVRRDLLWRWPVAGAGLLGGCLALIGLPPFNGFASKLLVYQAAARVGWWALALLLLAAGLALLAVVRMARAHLLGPLDIDEPADEPALLGATELDRPRERRYEPEPRGMALLTIMLLATCLAIGLYPQPVVAAIDRAIAGLTFVVAQ
jgi:formate hydrogenlyase subunit 3/multisubunit Na+/H+ antiporter MnhD subunit